MSRKLIFAITLIAVLLATGGVFYWQKKGKLVSEIENSEIEIADGRGQAQTQPVEPARQAENAPTLQSEQQKLLDSPSANSGSLEEYKAPIIPDNYLIKDIPFTPQAPFANWDEDRKEACEEAAVLMVTEWLKIKKDSHSDIALDANGWLDQNQTDAELMKMIDWQKQNYGGHRDLTIAETADFISKYYNGRYQAEIRYDINIEDIKSKIAQGNSVIVPAAGREMGNRYFQTPGPIYHMTVIIGYDKKDFITNDPGTKRGRNYRYPQQRLFDSIHDWNGSPDNINNGKKGMIIISNRLP